MIKYFYIVFATGAVVAALWIIGTFTHARTRRAHLYVSRTP